MLRPFRERRLVCPDGKSRGLMATYGHPQATELREFREVQKSEGRHDILLGTGEGRMKTRPEAGEYAASYEKYISVVPAGDIVDLLEAQRLQTVQLFSARSEREGNFRYAPGKWTVKDVLGHLSDSERIFAYRALRIA